MSVLYSKQLTLLSIVVGTLLLFVQSFPVSAQVRSSTNYQLQSDSVNLGGGLSTSTNYSLESTAGEIATGRSTSTNFSLQAGYQQMQEVFLSLSGGGDLIMDTDLPGITGGTSNGSTTFTVVTDSPSGYQLTIQAENDPAMQRADGASIANLSQYGGFALPYIFPVTAGQAFFGVSVDGSDVTGDFKSNIGVCGFGGSDFTDSCWSGISTSSSPLLLATSPDANHPLGATTSVQFQVGIGSGANIESGLYIATTTITALPL